MATSFNSLPPRIGNSREREAILTASACFNSLPPRIGNLHTKISSEILVIFNSLPPRIGNSLALRTGFSTVPSIASLQGLETLPFEAKMRYIKSSIASLQGLETNLGFLLSYDRSSFNSLPPRIGNSLQQYLLV